MAQWQSSCLAGRGPGFSALQNWEEKGRMKRSGGRAEEGREGRAEKGRKDGREEEGEVKKGRDR